MLKRLRAKKILIYSILAATLTAMLSGAVVTLAEETPERSFTGYALALPILANLDYTDVRQTNTWAKEAIWEISALEFMKGYGEKRFGVNETLTVEQAIAVAYNAVGREADAQAAAELLDRARAADARLYPAPKMWSDGYLQLAANDGLITQQDFIDALQTDQLALTGDNFLRGASATREEMAVFLGKLLTLAPINPQTRLFNSYRDWQEADPYNVPMLEAILQNGIMHGDNTGRFRPKAALTRAEAAQILVNAEPVTLPLLGLSKFKGTIEAITVQQDNRNGTAINRRKVLVRNSNGLLHEMNLVEPTVSFPSSRNELSGALINQFESVVVNNLGSLGTGSLLRAGQEISYVVDDQNRTRYIQVAKSGLSTTYILGRVISTDVATRGLVFQPYQTLPFADIRYADAKTLANIKLSGNTSAWTVSNGAKIFSDFVYKTFESIEPETHYILTVQNGMVTGMDGVTVDLLQEEGIVSGIVQENNPDLGYITLYAADGSGISAGLENGYASLRTYPYAGSITTTRDGKTATPESVLPGDSVYMRLDDDQAVEVISAASYYVPVHGTLLNRSGNNLRIQLPNGQVSNYDVPIGTPVYQSGRISSLDKALAGDDVKLLVQESGGNLAIREVNISRSPKLVDNIYRATFENTDDIRNLMTVSGVRRYLNGAWELSDEAGMMSIGFADGYQSNIDPRAVGTVFFAVRKDAAGREKIIKAVLRDDERFESVQNDTILTATPDGSRLQLYGISALVLVDEDTIVVRDNRLVDGSAIRANDQAKISTGKIGSATSLQADVVVAQAETGSKGLTIYRGRILDYVPNTTLTVESFAKLSGVKWDFSNTPKTFDIRQNETRLLEEGGIGNMRDFTLAEWKGKTVSLLVDGSKVLEISNAPYGDAALTGKITGYVGGTLDTDGKWVVEPSGYKISGARTYNPLKYTWELGTETEITLEPHTILLRKGISVSASGIQIGDQITMIRTVGSAVGRIIRVE